MLFLLLGDFFAEWLGVFGRFKVTAETGCNGMID